MKIGPSPLWLKQRLMAAGQRPISNVVDITNYVMLATGQPLHAFDLDEVRGGGSSFGALAEGETMTTLDDVERTFSAEAALVCDAEGPSGIAGIMGGQISEVSDSTNAGADGGRHLGRARTSCAPPRRSGCAPRRRPASRSSSTPSSRSPASGWPRG